MAGYQTLITNLQNDFSLNSTAATKAINKEVAELLKVTDPAAITWDSLEGLTDAIYHYSKDGAAALEDIRPEYKQIKDYLARTKIKYSPADKAEFSDDWQRVRCLIGLKTMSSKEGIEITIALQEINEICGVIFDTECSTQQGFIQLASYLQHRPDYNKLFVSSLKSAGYDLPGMVKEAITAQQTQIEKIKANDRPAAAAKVNYRIEENKQYNSKEIYFDRIPSKATREALKKLKFRWHNLKKCWYGFATLEAIKAAC